MKKVKIIIILLVIVLVTAISFFGIYQENRGVIENKVKDYSFGMDLTGVRTAKFSLSEGTKTEIKDAEGKTVDDSESLTDEQIAEKGYTKEEKPYNSDEDKNLDNYKKSKEIIEKRLGKLGVEQYNIKLDEQTGDIYLELPEKDEDTDNIISNSGTRGKFEIVDSETKEVLMNNDDIKSAKVMYGAQSQTSKGTTVYLDLEFNKEGTKKLEDITTTYVKKDDDENKDDKENSENTENTENTENAENKENEENKDKEKTITMKIDDEDTMTTSFEQPIKTGQLRLTVGSEATDEKTIKENVKKASNMANLFDTGDLPLKYENTQNDYILANIDNNKTEIAKYIILAIAGCALLFIIIKYKGKGILAGLSYIGFIATLLLLIRYANVVLSIEGIMAIGAVGILNYIFVNRLLKNDDVKEVYKKSTLEIIPILIFVITSCFMNWLPISSFGMVMFWGISLIAVYNILITNNLINKKSEERTIKNEKYE